MTLAQSVCRPPEHHLPSSFLTQHQHPQFHPFFLPPSWRIRIAKLSAEPLQKNQLSAVNKLNSCIIQFRLPLAFAPKREEEEATWKAKIYTAQQQKPWHTNVRTFAHTYPQHPPPNPPTKLKYTDNICMYVACCYALYACWIRNEFDQCISSLAMYVSITI